MSWEDRIKVEPTIRSGKPCVKGTRIAVYDVLEYMAGGMSEDEILADFPDLTAEEAVARKLLIALNAIARDRTAWQH